MLEGSHAVSHRRPKGVAYGSPQCVNEVLCFVDALDTEFLRLPVDVPVVDEDGELGDPAISMLLADCRRGRSAVRRGVSEVVKQAFAIFVERISNVCNVGRCRDLVGHG